MPPSPPSDEGMVPTELATPVAKTTRLKTYGVTLDGYPKAHRYQAETPSKARYACFRLWDEMFRPRHWTKREAWLWFSRNSSVWRVA